MTAALLAATLVLLFTPAVGVTQTKMAIMTTNENAQRERIAELNALCCKAMVNNHVGFHAFVTRL